MAKRYRLDSPNIKFEVHASGGPIDDPESAAELFQALGHASAAWARMEFMLDAVLLRINKISESPSLYNPLHPTGFKQKIERIKKWLVHPKLAPHKEIMHKTLVIMKELSQPRNEFLHSDVRSYDRSTGIFSIANMKSIGDDRMRLKEINYHIDAVTHLTLFSRKGALALSEWIDILDDISPRSQIDE